MNTKSDVVKLAKLLEQERALTLKIRALITKRDLLPKGRFTCVQYADNGLTIEVTLADLLALFPDTEGRWLTYPCDDGSIKGYFEYGPVFVSTLRPNYHLWVKASTKTTVISEPVKTEEENFLIQEAIESGPEEPLSRERFDAARQAARAAFAEKQA